MKKIFSLKKEFSENAKFYKSLFNLVLPIAVQSLIANAVNSADVFMLGIVGQTELSAVSLANQFQVLLWGIFFGINSGITVMSAQYWGKKDTDTIQTVMGIALKIAFVVTGVLSILAIVFPAQMMHIYTNDTALIEIGVKYLRVIGISYFISAFPQVFQTTLRTVERAGVATVISSATLIGNVVLNAVFIFGLLGAPKLGVVGVALATLISRILELLICMFLMFKGIIFKPDMKLIFGSNRLLRSDFYKYSMPALINDFSWTVAFSLYSVIMGHLNSDIVAANSVAVTIKDLCTILGFAIASGASVIIGIEIGEGQYEKVKEDAKRSLYVTLVVGVLTGLLLIGIRPLILKIFSLNDRATGYLGIMMFIMSYYSIGQFINTLMIAGLFRAGGQTKWGMYCDLVAMWVVSLPLGFLNAFVFKLPPMVVYFVLCLDEFWKMPVVFRHYKKYSWIKDITREKAA